MLDDPPPLPPRFPPLQPRVITVLSLQPWNGTHKKFPCNGSVSLNKDDDIPTDVAVNIHRSCSRKNFGVNIYQALFTANARATCNVSGSFGKGKLDPLKIDAIRRTVFALWSSEPSETETSAWRKVVIAIDEANRCHNRTQSL